MSCVYVYVRLVCECVPICSYVCLDMDVWMRTCTHLRRVSTEEAEGGHEFHVMDRSQFIYVLLQSVCGILPGKQLGAGTFQ